MVYVCQLPNKVQEELLRDCERLLRKYVTDDEDEIIESLDNVRDEKLINVIGCEEDALPSYEKYARYL